VGRRASWVPQYGGHRGGIRMHNYSPKTLATYRLWMRKFQSFLRSKPADELDGEDAKEFLTDLAVRQVLRPRRRIRRSTRFCSSTGMCCAGSGVVRAKRRPHCAGGAFAFGILDTN